MTMELYELTAKEITTGIRDKQFSAEDVVKACISHLEAGEKTVNACITVTPERAVERARAIDKKIASNEDVGPLAGVPYVAKDNFCTRDIRTTCGSKMLESWTPTYDATAIRYLEEAGAVLLAKTNLDEFAMGSSTETSIFGPTKNPRDLKRVPGGSSGGSAAAVAAGYAPLALGSDTGGSVRQPSAFCGVQGMKPSYGQVSRYGVVGYASSLDQVSPISRSVEDLAHALEVLARPDPNDTTCDAYDRPRFTEALSLPDLKGKRIGVFEGFESEKMDKDLYDTLMKTAELCKAAGAVVEPMDLPLAVKYGVATYYVTALADASSKLACFDGMRYGTHIKGDYLFDMYTNTRTEGFGEEVRRRIILGTCLLTEGFYQNYYAPALKVRTKIIGEFDELFKRFDAYLLPASPSMPYKIGMKEEDPTRLYLGDIFTVPISLGGLPGISLNMGFTPTEGLPLSVQLVGSRYGDAELLGIASVLEKAVGRPHIASLKEVA